MAMDTLSINDRNGTAKTVPVHVDEDGNIQTVVSLDGSIATFSAGALAIAPTSSTGIRVVGSATKTVRVRKIVIGGVATAAANITLTLSKYSTTGTAGLGVWVAATNVPHDSGNDAGTAVVEHVTVDDITSPGTLVGIMRAGRLQLAASGTGAYVAPTTFDFGTGGQQALVLRGAAENVNIGLGSLPAGAALDVYVEWTEESE